jgi:Acyl carrier protein
VTAEVVKVVDAPAAPPKSGPRTPEEIRAAVLAVISARTGYPADMLETDLDLEADLSIDSIKRTEIIGELADRVGLTGAGNGVDESVVEQLARIKRIGEIVDWIADRTFSGGQEDLRVDEPADSSASPAVSAPRRYVVRAEPAPQRAESEPVGDRFVAQRFVIVDDGCGIALELAGLLEQHGARVCTPLKPDGPTDGLIHLGALRPGSGPVLPEGYGGLRDALLSGPRWLIVATGSAGTFGHGYDADGAGDPTAGAGLCGLARTVAQEFPDVLVRAVDVDTKDAPRAVAGQLFAELLAADSPVVVGYAGGARRTLAVVPTEPPIDTPLSLSADAVVLLTGGARGITARTAIALARATGCHVELIGRTPAPDGPSDLALAAATDEVAIRQALIERGSAARRRSRRPHAGSSPSGRSGPRSTSWRESPRRCVTRPRTCATRSPYRLWSRTSTRGTVVWTA